MKIKNDRIVFVNQSVGYLMIDIINAFAESGYYTQIALIAGNIKGIERIDKKVTVSRMKLYKRNTLIRRIFSWTVGTVQSLIIILWKYRRFHMFLTSNPPTISFITLLCRNRYSALIYDVYPEGLVWSGFISENSVINKVWSKFNNRFYRKAQHVFTITDGMAEGIKAYNPSINVKVIPIWHDELKGVPEDKKCNHFITLHGLHDKFIVMYSGNMGKGHDIEKLVYVANDLKDEKDIVFIFIGEGWKKTIIQDLIRNLNLTNCMVLPYQTEDMFPHSLSAADVNVVSAPVGTDHICVPSKTYNLISLGIPILGIAEKNSELYQLIENNDIGACFSREYTNKIALFILSLKNNRDEIMRYKKNTVSASAHYSSDNAYMFVNSLNGN